jgi:uncharacterized protein (DUF2147 family)
MSALAADLRRSDRWLRLGFVVFCSLCITTTAAEPLAGLAADTVVGRWRTEGGKGEVEIFADPVGSTTYSGRIASGREGPDAPKDEHNPDPALRSRPLLGLIFMTGFRHQGEGRYSGGRIYDPNSGRTYSGKLRLKSPDELVLRGYLGISLLGGSQTWTRIPAAE